MTKASPSDILDLAFALGLSTPKLTTGYDKRSTIHVVTHGLMPHRHTVMIYGATSLEDAGKKLAESGNIPRAEVAKAIASIQKELA